MHKADCHWLRNPMERVHPELFENKSPMYQACCHGANHHRIGRGEVLKRCCDVGSFPERKMLLPSATTHHPYHDWTGVDAEPHSEVNAVLCRQMGIQRGDGLDNAQASVHRASSIIFMGHGVAKIDQQPISKVLGDMALVALDDLGSGLLVGTDYRAQVFGVELAGELRGAYQITE